MSATVEMEYERDESLAWYECEGRGGEPGDRLCGLIPDGDHCDCWLEGQGDCCWCGSEPPIEQ